MHDRIGKHDASTRSLADLSDGQTARIAGVVAKWEAAKRLADMGFIRGARVKVLRRGSPCVVRIDGVVVGLGSAHQRSLLVEPGDASGGFNGASP